MSPLQRYQQIDVVTLTVTLIDISDLWTFTTFELLEVGF